MKWQLFLKRGKAGLFVLLPVSAVLATLYVIARPVSGGPSLLARVYGGPTEGVTELAVRVVAEAHGGARLDTPIVAEVVAPSAGTKASVRGELSAGFAELVIPLTQRTTAAPLHLAVYAEALPESPLASGEIALTRKAWLEPEALNEPFFYTASEGQVSFSLGLESGVLAVPFESAALLELKVSGAGQDAFDLDVEVDGDGISVEPTRFERRVQGDLPLPIRLTLSALEHTCTLSIRVSATAGKTGGRTEFRRQVRLPVVPGALWVEQRPAQLLIRSPIEKERAFLSFVSETERLGGAVVPLRPSVNGSAEGIYPLPTGLPTPAWVVVSSEAEGQSQGRVGLPLFPNGQQAAEPGRTRAVADRLLLDGVREAAKAAEQRQRRLRNRVIGYCLGAGLLVSFLLWREHRRAALVPLTLVLLGFSLLGVFLWFFA